MKERGGRKGEKRPANELVEKFPYLARAHTHTRTHTHTQKLNRRGLNAANPIDTAPNKARNNSCQQLQILVDTVKGAVA